MLHKQVITPRASQIRQHPILSLCDSVASSQLSSMYLSFPTYAFPCFSNAFLARFLVYMSDLFSVPGFHITTITLLCLQIILSSFDVHCSYSPSQLFLDCLIPTPLAMQLSSQLITAVSSHTSYPVHYDNGFSQFLRNHICHLDFF